MDLPLPGRAEERDDLAGLRVDVDVREHGADVVVAEADVLEADVAADGRRAAARRALLHRRLGVEELEDALGGADAARDAVDREADGAHRELQQVQPER